MRTLFVLIVAGLVGGGAGYVAPIGAAVEDEPRTEGAPTIAVSASPARAGESAPQRGESARRLVAGIVACDAREDTRVASSSPGPERQALSASAAP